MKIKSYCFLRDEYVHLLEKRLHLQQKLQSMRSYGLGEIKETSWNDMESYKKRSSKRTILQMEHDKIKRILGQAKVFPNDALHCSLSKKLGSPKVGIGRKVSLQIQDMIVNLMIGGYKTLSGRLSYASPLGRSLLGKCQGTEVEMRCGDEVRTVKLLQVS